MRTIPLGTVAICSSCGNAIILKTKNFLNFLFRFLDLHQIWNIFKKKMIVLANVFADLQTAKDLLKPLSRKCRLRTSFDSQRVSGCQTLVKSAGGIFYHICRSLWGKMTGKLSPFLNFEILRVFLNILTADDKYPVGDFFFVKISSSILKCIYLCKRKTFSDFLFNWWNFHQILDIFGK